MNGVAHNYCLNGEAGNTECHPVYEKKLMQHNIIGNIIYYIVYWGRII